MILMKGDPVRMLCKEMLHGVTSLFISLAAVLTQLTSVTDGQTDIAIACLYLALQ